MTHALLKELVSQVDLLESLGTQSFGWKPHFNQVIDEINAVSASVEAQGENSNNVLFRILVKQNNILVALLLLVLISGSRIQK